MNERKQTCEESNIIVESTSSRFLEKKNRMPKQGGRSCMGCRRIVLRVLIWRHSARQHHLALRGFSSPLVSSRPRQSPGFNIKPSLIWSSRSPPLFSVPPPVSVSAMADSRWIFCHCTDVRSTPYLSRICIIELEKETWRLWKLNDFLEMELNEAACNNVSLFKII